jgi:hypothetical protein
MKTRRMHRGGAYHEPNMEKLLKKYLELENIYKE